MMCLKRCRRGIVGIEAAIVLIAFVIIAAALAYVVVNTGFYASQKSKETIMRGIGEAASSLQLDGSVIAYTSNSQVKYIIVPVKVSVGKEGIDVSNKSVAVTVRISGSASVYMPNIYNGTYDGFDATNITVTLNEITGDDPVAYIAIVNSDGDELLESSEKGFLIIYLGRNVGAAEYDKVKVEVKTSLGASLVVEREIPVGLSPNDFVDLG